MSEILVFCTLEPPLGRLGRALYLRNGEDYYDLTKFHLSRPYGLGCTISFREQK